METQLTYDNKSRHLGIRFRERYTTREGLQAKVRENWRGKREKRNCKRPLFFRGKKKKKRSASLVPLPLPQTPSSPPSPPPKKKVIGELDTVTGGLEFHARVEKILGPPLPDASAPWRLKRAALARPRAAAGVSYCSRRDALLARVSAGGSRHLGDELWIGVKGVLELDTRTQAATAAGRLSLSKNLFDFSPWQQLRLAAGVDVAADARGRVTRVPFLAVRENNWSAVVDDRGRLSVRYDL